MRKTFLVLFLTFLFLITFALAQESWQYRVPIAIVEKIGNTLTDFQINITLDTKNLISAGKLRKDCGDIRFTDSDRVTQLSYWNETPCDSVSTNFWVKVPYIPASGSKLIYLFYGNPSATSTSNGANTFNFFDSFDSTSLDTTKWVVDTTDYSVSSSVLRINKGAVRISNALPFNLNGGYILEGKVNYYVNTPTKFGGTLTGVSSTYTQTNNAGSDATVLYMRDDGTKYAQVFIGSGSKTSFDISNGVNVFTPATLDNVWYVLGEKFHPNGVILTKDYSDMLTKPVTWTKNPVYITLGAFQGDPNYDIKDTGYDWIRVRKYASTEPTIIIGNEISAQLEAGYGSGSIEIKTYSATFSQTGIPSGTTWGVTVDGTRYTSTSSSITVDNLAGTISYSYDSTVPHTTNTRIHYSCGTGCTGSVTPDDTSKTATYVTQYKVTISVSPSASGYTSPTAGTYWYNSSYIVSISATPRTGYTFSSWSTSTTSISIESPSSKSTKATINGPGTITANFNALPGKITGIITNALTDAPIAGVTVTDGTRTATTGTDGKYTISNIPVGTYTVTASASGFETISKIQVSISAGSTKILHFELPLTSTCSYSLDITPEYDYYISYYRTKSWRITAKDYSSSVCPTNIAYTIRSSTQGSCPSTSIPNSFTINRGGTTTFDISVTRGFSGCVVNLEIIDSNTRVAAVGSYSVVPSGSFDFTTNVFPATGYTLQGSGNSSYVTVSLLESSPTVVGLSATGLPTGASISFVPDFSSPTFVSRMSVTTSSSTSPGTYPITITGKTGGLSSISRSTTYTLIVTSPPPNTGTIIGTVKDSSNNQLIQDATVSDGTRTTITNANGQYSISNVPAGTYTVTASKSGYESQSKSATVTAGATTTIDFTLTLLPTCVRSNPSVSISPSSQTGTIGQTLTYAVSMTNNDNSVCSISTFSLSNSCPSGWTCTLASPSLTSSPGSTSSTTISVISADASNEETYTFSVTATNEADTTKTATASASYVVNIIRWPAISIISPATITDNTNFDVSLTYTHDEANSGGIMLRWLDNEFDLVSGPCDTEYYKNPSWAPGWEGMECSNIPSGTTKTFTLKSTSTGTKAIYYRSWDTSNDAWCTTYFDYHRSPSTGTCSSNCDNFPDDWELCDANAKSIDVVSTPSTTLSANPTSVLADGASTSTITAQTSDSKSGITVSYTTTLGTLSATTCNTDATGKCSVTIKSSIIGTATITGSATGYNSGVTAVEFTSTNTKPRITAGIDYTGSTSPNGAITFWCTAEDSEQGASTLNVKAYVGTCNAFDCFNTRDWSTGLNGEAMQYNSISGKFEYPWTIPWPEGTTVAGTCVAYDAELLESNWGDRYPLFTVTSTATGTIAGTVKDNSNNAIDGATVSDGTRTATTDVTGQYTISNIPAGTYTVTASKSGYESQSKSATVTAGTTTPVDFTLTINNPPNTPSVPSGPTSGFTGTSYSYSTSATDPNGDDIKYIFDFGDNTRLITTDIVVSGTSASASHVWSSPGVYSVKAKAVDTNEAESSFSSPLTVTITHPPDNTPPLIIEGIDYTGNIDSGGSITFLCTVEDGEQSASTLNVKAWVGTCNAFDCFNTRDWSTGLNGEMMQYNSISGRFEYPWTIPWPEGTTVAGTCVAYDAELLESNWGDRYPFFTIPPIGEEYVESCVEINGICELGETQDNCRADCYSIATMDPTYVNPGQDVYITIEFWDSRYLADNDIGFLMSSRNKLTGKTDMWSSLDCAITTTEGNRLKPSQWTDESLIPEDLKDDLVDWQSEDIHFKIEAKCKIPEYLDAGTYELTIIPAIY